LKKCFVLKRRRVDKHLGCMRGNQKQQSPMFSYIGIEERIPAEHPLRAIRRSVDEVLRALSRRFDQLYEKNGRPSIPPEHLLRALLLQMFYSIRSERMLMEQLQYNLLFRWFVGLGMDEEVWNHAVFSKNRERLLNEEITGEFFREALQQAQGHLSTEHFTVDGTLIEAWASQKSFQRKDGGGGDAPGNFHGEKRGNQTHASKSDPDARLYKKSSGSEAKLSYLGHVVVENREGLIVEAMVTQADGRAEEQAALLMADALRKKKRGRRWTLGGDQGYDRKSLVQTLQEMQVTPHFAQNNTHRSSALDGRSTRHAGYALSQSRRPMIERVFAWLKSIAGMRKVKLRGLEKVGWLFPYAAAAYNLWRIPRLARAAT
jgi:transposase